MCRTSGSLHVAHQTILPDRMECGVCGAAFEMQSGGAHIRLMALPGALSGRASDLLDTWLLPGEVPTIGRRGTGGLVDESFAQDLLPPAPTPSAARVDNFAADLLPPAPPGTGSLRTCTGALPARTGTTGPLSPPQPAPDAAGPLPKTYNTAPLTPPAGAKPTTPPVAPAHTARPTTVPLTAPAKVALHEELDGVLKMLPERPARSDEALADELARLLGGLPAVAPEPAAETAPAAAVAASGDAAAMDETTGVVPTQPIVRGARAEAALDVQKAAPGTGAAAAARARPALDKARVAEFSEQARQLHQLGNSIEVIRVTLERSGAAPAEARAALASIARAEAARQRRFRQTLTFVGGGALVILLLLLAIALVISRPVPASGPVGTTTGAQKGGAAQPAGTATPSYNPIIALINNLMPQDVKIANGPSPSPGPTSVIQAVIFPPTATLSPAARATEAAAVRDSGLPDWVGQLVPPGITVINVPTPSVDTHGPPNSICPVTSAAAAALFGGRANDWTFHGDSGGWILILAAEPAIIQVPANMSAGYLVLGSNLEMRSTLGPATIHNVNFIAISCS